MLNYHWTGPRLWLVTGAPHLLLKAGLAQTHRQTARKLKEKKKRKKKKKKKKEKKKEKMGRNTDLGNPNFPFRFHRMAKENKS